MRLASALLLLALASLASACPSRVQSAQGCSYDEECARGEACKQGVCVAAPPGDAGSDADAGPRLDAGGARDAGADDAGPGRDAGATLEDAGVEDAGVEDAGVDAGGADAGPGEIDGGPSCVPDDLDNESPDTPYTTSPELSDGRVLAGRLCPGGDEHFGFFGYSGDPIQVVATWGADKDLDLALTPPGGTSSGIGLSVHRRMEVTTRTLATTGEQLLRLYPVGGADAAGVDYEMQVRSGLPCRTEDGCGPSDQCLMPLWTPTSANGTAPTEPVIFSGGLCGPAYVPCSPTNADNAGGEGVSTSRDTPYQLVSAANVWSCRFDEDWFRFGMGVTGDLVISFTNRSITQTPGTFLVTVFDAAGNMLGGAGFDELAFDTLRTVVVPFLAEDTVVYVRVLQLNDDDTGAYSFNAQAVAGSCGGATDCEATSTRRYGRTQCRSGACECPVANACTPPG